MARPPREAPALPLPPRRSTPREAAALPLPLPHDVPRPREAPALPLPLPNDVPRRPAPSDHAPATPGPPERREPEAQETAVEPRGLADDDGFAIPGAQDRFGRYVVLRQVGSGGMGVVLAAYDRDLDRKVAIKLLRPDIHDNADGALRMRREAQAMARLSHPHVAQVYEAGELHGQLFLVMEFIEGVTLRAWLADRPRSWREVLDVYLQAGRGLSAAHVAGLTHRDFKPDNAMLGADGRVRVLDFGLSRGRGGSSRPILDVTRQNLADLAVTAAGSILGTPAYMSPEQFYGEEATAHSDQFSYCVAVWEAVHGARPFAGHNLEELRVNVLSQRIVPAPADTRAPVWLRNVLRRGLSLRAEDRWPTIDDLLTALSRDPGQAWRRRLAVGLAVVGVAAAGYGFAAYQSARTQRCGGAADDLADIWDAPRRAALAAAVHATGASYADVALAASIGHLDAYHDRWVAAHTAACEAHERGHTSDQLYDRRMMCLRLRRADLAATVDVLTQTTPETVAQAVDTAAGLPPIAACDDDARLMADTPLPADPTLATAVGQASERLARLQALERNGRFVDAVAGVDPLLVEAERLGHLPHLAAAHLLAGRLHMYSSQFRRALIHLERAEALGLEAHADPVAAEAVAHWIFCTAYGESRADAALAAAPRAWGLVRRVGAPPGLAALLHTTVSTAHSQNGDLERASRESEAGLALLVEHLPDDPLRLVIVDNLTEYLSESGRLAEARARALAELPRAIAAYGECHPFAAVLRVALARAEGFDGAYDAAIADGERAFACFADSLPGYAMRTLSILAHVHAYRGDVPAVRATLARGDSLVARFPDHAIEAGLLGIHRARLALDDDRPDESRRLLEDLRRKVVEHDPRHRVLMLIDTHLARAALHVHDPGLALEHLQRAEQIGARDLAPDELGRYVFTRARTLRALGREPTQVAELAGQAIRAYELAGRAFAPQIAEIRAWLASP